MPCPPCCDEVVVTVEEGAAVEKAVLELEACSLEHIKGMRSLILGQRT
jgi:hypothetical protein